MKRNFNVKTALLIIDPQNDFMDVPGAALPVPGAKADMARLVALLDRAARSRGLIDHITVSMDTHDLYDIAHPAYWRDAEGNPPTPSTVITDADLESGRWRTTNPEKQAHALWYVRELARSGNYALRVWPTHCVANTWGWEMEPGLVEAIRQSGASFSVIRKGENVDTEHFSAFEAEVPLKHDPQTALRVDTLETLLQYDRVLVAGEAASHCVLSSLKSMASYFGSQFVKVILLTDCTSPVVSPDVDFARITADAVRALQTKGMQTARSTDIE